MDKFSLTIPRKGNYEYKLRLAETNGYLMSEGSIQHSESKGKKAKTE